MTWVLLEGLDRTGKSTIAKEFESKGFKSVHMQAPSKKYFEEGYAGPSYVDEMVDLYMSLDGQDVVFDRSPYGELIWPYVYNRKAMLADDEIEMLREFEDKNQSERYLMFDSNVESHWKRCVANKEPINRSQFSQANTLYMRLAKEHAFVRKELQDFKIEAPAIAEQPKKETVEEVKTAATPGKVAKTTKTQEQLKLEKANAINVILSKPILKGSGPLVEELEKDLRGFLNLKLADIFGQSTGKQDPLTLEEVQILKAFCNKLKDKTK